MEDECDRGASPPTKNPSKLMDTEPGGENTPYESQQLFGQIELNEPGSDENREQESLLEPEVEKKCCTEQEKKKNTQQNVTPGSEFGGKSAPNLGKANQGSMIGKIPSDKT